MRKWMGLMLLLTLVLLLPALGMAEEAAIHSVDIQVLLMENGDAKLTEHWDVTVTGGTEWYLALNNMKGMDVTGLSVSDETGAAYTLLDGWDVDRTLTEKAGTCGILRKGSDDYELCWGVGSYGRHQFLVSYTIEGLVKRYSDGTGFLHTFLSRDLSSPVQSAQVRISHSEYALDESTAAIWAFGYEGDIHFSQGDVLARSDEAMKKSAAIIIMLELDPALFPAARAGEGTFEAIKTRAFEGSDYNGGWGTQEKVIFAVAMAVFLLIAFAIVYGALRSSLPDVYYRRAYGMSAGELRKGAQPMQRIPFEGDMLKTVGIMAAFSLSPSVESLFSYYLLKWFRAGAITQTMEEKKGKQVVTLQFGPMAHGSDVLGERLYGMLLNASRQGELTQKGIEKWAEGKSGEIGTWYKEYKKAAVQVLELTGAVTQEHLRRAFVSANVDVLNEKGWQYAMEVYGFRNYLAGAGEGAFDAIDEELWQDYLVYADVFGITDTVEGYYEHYPHDGMYPYGYYYYIRRSFRTSYRTGVNNRSSGGGGSSSSGGGGGSSGGGGGGSR